MPLNTIQLLKVKNVRLEYMKLIGKVIEIKTFRWKTNIKKMLGNLHLKTGMTRYLSLYFPFVIAVFVSFQKISRISIVR